MPDGPEHNSCTDHLNVSMHHVSSSRRFCDAFVVVLNVLRFGQLVVRHVDNIFGCSMDFSVGETMVDIVVKVKMVE